MNWYRNIRGLWLRYAVAVLIIAIASAIRSSLFADLGRGTAYLTYYPAVVLAALYGGLYAGLLATAVSAWLAFYWIQQGYMFPVESMAMGVFLLSCTMISGIAEAMRRAQTRAKQEKEKAEAANLAKSVFLSSMSHELRTPLNAILGFSSLMRNDPRISEEQRKNLDIINRSGENLLVLINDVLDMAKIEAGRISVEAAALDLGEMVREVCDLMRLRAEEKDVQLRLDQSSAFPRFVRTDSAKLRQVLINLLGNAIKFTAQGEVTLRLKAEPAASEQGLLLIVEIEDSGIGIAAEDQARMFEPFVQIGTQNLQKGTGLGLAITRKFVDLLGGRISVQSTLGRGSTFRVEFPVARAEASDLGAIESKHSRIVTLAPGQAEYRILIVEDQVENWMLLKQLLEPVGFQVRVATNGAEAIEMFQAWRPHFIWMDIRMPMMNGLEATRRIRALEGGREVKIAAITASVFKEERDAVMATGIDDFVRKPFRQNEIYDCLVRQLGVRFVHEDTPAPANDGPAAALQPEALAHLPQALRLELGAALVELDAARITGIIGRIAKLNPALGKLLTRYADQYAYTVILQALQAGADHSSGKTSS